MLARQSVTKSEMETQREKRGRYRKHSYTDKKEVGDEKMDGK